MPLGLSSFQPEEPAETNYVLLKVSLHNIKHLKPEEVRWVVEQMLDEKFNSEMASDVEVELVESA